MRRFALLLAVPMMLMALSFSYIPQANAQASSVTSGLNQAAGAAGVRTQGSLIPIIGNIVQVAIGFTGMLLVVMMVYAGFLYFSALGEAAKVEKAKKLIIYSITGMIIVVMSYAISSYVIEALSDVASGSTPATPAAGQNEGPD